ncbi:hypothetical protein TCAL_04906 [Tigriopus californicus]|uniref:Cadherin domain-containing protein n=1 Tax=Tigriopus californicus TaxID=6832 RepID=A0A553NBH4_TIGCA|nr:hypothetical protein TCAL_04906 [Tigriopus californicus]
MCSAGYLLQPRVGRRQSNCQRTKYAPSPGGWVTKMLVFLVLFSFVASSSESGVTPSSRSDRLRTSVSKSYPFSTKSSPKFIQNQKPSADMADVEDEAVERIKPFKFTQSSYSGSIPENSPGKVHVVPDSKMGLYVNQTLFGPGGPYTMRFRIKAGDPEDFFKAEAELVGDFIFLIVRTRTSNLNVLNRERTTNYELDIRARVREARGAKGAKRPHGNRIKGFPDPKTILRVTVVDTNDLNPFFQPPIYTFSVPEDTPLHTSIGQVRAEDADDGINGEIYYSILGSYLPSIFAVDPITGILSLTRPLSFKEEPTHRQTIVAQDRGAKPTYASGQADTAAVTVHVEQVNLHDPVMQIQHLPELIEQSNADIYAIIRITDPDPDRHGEVESVEIIEGDTDAHFRIRPSNDDKKEFNIEVLQLLDREIAPYGYNLTIKAVDRGIPPRIYYQNTHVQLADLNDHAPVFDHEVYEVKVKENAPINTPLVRLKVSDEDSGRNARVKLNIAAGNENKQFRIDPKSGVLFVAQPLDAETRSSYTLSVSAFDDASAGMRKQSAAKVRVLVEDVNDNDPMFESSEKVIFFNENEQPGTRVMRLNAMDADSGENGYISYSIANLNEVPFEIDHFTGIIKSKWLIDFESDQHEYRLVVRASDWGTPYRRQAELRLTIRIRDINDNRPQFERMGCVGEIARDVGVGTELITLSALDFDAGNLISYRIVSGNADGCFGLDQNTGVISVVCDLRTLPMRERVLNVTATDGQHFSDVTPVIIKLTSESSGRKGSRKGYSSVFSAIGTDDSLFACEETDVAKRLTDTLALVARNNQIDSTNEDVFQASGARFMRGQNVHQPEFDVQQMPREIKVNETMPSGSILLKTLILVLARSYSYIH